MEVLDNRMAAAEQVVRDVLPAHLIQRLISQLQGEGWQFRGDVIYRLNAAAARALSFLYPNERHHAVARVMNTGSSLLAVGEGYDTRLTMLAACKMARQLWMHGHIRDPHTPLPTIADSILEDAEGEGTAFIPEEQTAQRLADRMMSRLRLQQVI